MTTWESMIRQPLSVSSFIDLTLRAGEQRLQPRRGKLSRTLRSTRLVRNGARTHIEALRIGTSYQTTFGTLWKDGTYFPRGTVVMVTGLHLEQGFCVRFPAEVDGEPLETWEEWTESEFLADHGTIDVGNDLSAAVLAEAREVLDDAEEGTHLHLHEHDTDD